MRFLLPLLLVSFSLTQVSPQSDFGSIEGIVIDATTKQPVARAQVSLRAPSGSREPSSPIMIGLTDGEGRFKLSVAPGSYLLNIQREGYFRPGASSLQRVGGTNNSLTIPVVVVAKQQVVEKYSLIRGGIISGRVLDDTKRPLPGVPIAVLQLAYTVDGRVILSDRTSDLLDSTSMGGRPATETNDKGEFRLFWLPPGEYYVRADVNERRGTQDLLGGGLNSTSGYVSTFYPSATNRAAAEPIVVHGGLESTAELIMQKPTTFTVSGQVVLRAPLPSPPQRGGRSAPVPMVRYWVFPQSDEILETDQNHPPFLVPNGFRISGLLAGSYDIAMTTVGYPLWGKAQIHITDHNVEGVVIEVLPNLVLKTRIVSETSLPPEQTFSVHLSPLTPGYPTPQAMGSSGFEIPNVPPGPYRVLAEPSGEALPGRPMGWYLSDIRQGSRNLNDSLISVNADTPPIELLVRQGGGSITGVVRGPTTLGTSDQVLLVPQPPRRQSFILYKRATVSMRDGSFTLSDIAPGSYRLFARLADEMDANGFLNEQFLARYETRGRLVNISDNGHLDGIELELIPREFQ